MGEIADFMRKIKGSSIANRVSSVHKGIPYIHQIGITTLAPALVIESLLGHSQAIATLTAGILQHSKQASATLTLLQANRSAPASGVGERTAKQKQGRELMTENTREGGGKSRKMGAIHGLRYAVSY